MEPKKIERCYICGGEIPEDGLKYFAANPEGEVVHSHYERLTCIKNMAQTRADVMYMISELMQSVASTFVEEELQKIADRLISGTEADMKPRPRAIRRSGWDADTAAP